MSKKSTHYGFEVVFMLGKKEITEEQAIQHVKKLSKQINKPLENG